MGFRTTINRFKYNEQKRDIESSLKRLEVLQKHFINRDISEDEFCERNDLISKLNILLPKKVVKNSFRNYKNYLRHCKNSKEILDEVSAEVSAESPDKNFVGSSDEILAEKVSAEHISSPLHFSYGSNIPTGFTPCEVDGDGTCCKDKKQQSVLCKVLAFFNR